MENRVAAIMLNYNMGEVVEQNINYILHSVRYPVDIFVVDQSPEKQMHWWPLDNGINGIDDIACYMKLSQNLHATQGFNLCCRMADAYAEYHDLGEYFAYWVITTTCELNPEGTRTDDVLTPCVKYLEDNPDTAVIQPAYRPDSIGFWEHLKDRGTGQPREVHMIEHTAALFNGDWFREIGFMEPQIHVHGTDLWYSYQARMEEKPLIVHEGTWIRRHNDNMHQRGRSFEGSAAGRTNLARQSLERFGQGMLGPNWEMRMMNEHIKPEMIS